MRKLQQELDAANFATPVSYKNAHSLSYMDAVIKEAIRMHPGVGLILERIVPEGGLVLSDGRVIAPGTIVGMNAWVVHPDKTVFGPDAESYVPERWLRQEDESEIEVESRRVRMREADLTFGSGSRICIGKNLGFLEIYKLVAAIFTVYDVSPDVFYDGVQLISRAGLSR